MRIVKSIFSSVFSIMFSAKLSIMSLTKFFVILPALLIAVVLSSLSWAATSDRIAGALTNGQTVTLKGNVHRKALPQFDQGPVDPATLLRTITLMTQPTAAHVSHLQQLLPHQL